MTTDEATPSEKTDTAPATLSEGQKLAGCYMLKARLSDGPLGDVWLAHDEVLGKDISLEFVPDRIRHDSKAVGDIRREIKRSRQLIHPNILRVYDFIEEPDWAAVSMDAFDGESLESVLSKKENRILPLSEVESWFPQLCETLDDAHKIGLIHRNLSPSSIYFRQGGGIFLTGFGFSRCVSDALRRMDGAQGPEFARISPQLMDGESANRSDDIYASGALLYELLTGTPPLAGDDLAEQIRKTVPKPVNESRPKDLEPVPQSWEKGIAASLSKNPADRPASAGAFARQLAAAPAGDSTEAAAVAIPAAEASSLAPEAVRETKEADVVKEKAVKEATEPAKAPVEQGTSPFRRRSISTTGEPGSTGTSTTKAAEKTPAFESNTPSTQEKTARPKPARPDPYPSIYGNRSNFPAVPFAIAIGLIVVGYIGYHFIARHKTDSNGAASENSGTEQTTEGIAPPVNAPSTSGPGNEGENPSGKTPDSTAAAPGSDGKSPTASGKKPPVAIVSAPLPNPATPKPAPSSPSASPAEKALAEKQSALEAAKLSVRAAEKSVADLTAAQQKVAADAAAAQKALDDKTKALAPTKKTVEELLAKKKKLEDDQKTAEAAALQAQQAAEEKQRLAAAAKQAVEDMTAKNKDKLADLDKADAELAALKKALEEKQQAAAQGTKAVADADAARRKQLDAVTASEQEVAAAQAAIANAEKNRLAREEQKKELDLQVAALKKMMDDKLQEIELKRKQLESGVVEPASPSTPPPAPVKSPGKSTPPPRTSSVPVPPATPPESLPLPKPLPDQAKLATQGGPSIELNLPPDTQPATTGGDANTLGQRFVPVGDVEFCIWQTRVKDFDEFAKAVNLKSSGWRTPGFKQGPDHPVVNVSWIEATAFCKWLTDKEHKEGVLPAHQFYRLPTDLEWSKAVGLPDETGRTPSDRDMVITDVYPWGKDWPPPAGAGNYTGEETASDVAIKGYNDGFVWTSPVGSFKANKFGLYDMGGNVWQWCMDSWDSVSKGKVLRGASWYNGALKLSLLSSCRVHAAPDSSTDNYGFRIVKATDASRSARK